MKADESKQTCGCPWDGSKCPHCNRNVLFMGELHNRHMPRCHNEKEGSQ